MSPFTSTFALVIRISCNPLESPIAIMITLAGVQISERARIQNFTPKSSAIIRRHHRNFFRFTIPSAARRRFTKECPLTSMLQRLPSLDHLPWLHSQRPSPFAHQVRLYPEAIQAQHANTPPGSSPLSLSKQCNLLRKLYYRRIRAMKKCGGGLTPKPNEMQDSQRP